MLGWELPLNSRRRWVENYLSTIGLVRQASAGNYQAGHETRQALTGFKRRYRFAGSVSGPAAEQCAQLLRDHPFFARMEPDGSRSK